MKVNSRDWTIDNCSSDVNYYIYTYRRKTPSNSVRFNREWSVQFGGLTITCMSCNFSKPLV
jgi:hypothetical protein